MSLGRVILMLMLLLPPMSSPEPLDLGQRYTYRVLQTIQMKLIVLCVWAEPVLLGSTRTALKFKYEIQIG